MEPSALGPLEPYAMTRFNDTTPAIERKIVPPAELDLDSPGRRDYWVALEHDHTWADHLIPLTVMVGPEVAQERGLVASGANHGNEYEGPVAIKHLLHDIDSAQVRGRLILIPVLNPSAFGSGNRASVADDGVNLNRAFVEGAGIHPALGGITHRIARFYREMIWPRVHVAIDVHSGGQVINIAQCTSFHRVDDPAQTQAILDTARWFGTPFIMNYQNLTPGLLPSEGERLGKIMIGTEMGHGEAVNRDGVRRSMHGIIAAAIHHDQLHGHIEPIDHHADQTQRLVALEHRHNFVVAPRAGWFEPRREVGEPIQAGETLALLHDFQRIDEPGLPLTAAADGYVFGLAWQARVRQGQHVAVVAEPAPA